MDKNEIQRRYNIAKVGKLILGDTDISITFTDSNYDEIPYFKAYNCLLLLATHTFFLVDDGGKSIKPNLYDTLTAALMKNYIRKNADYLGKTKVKEKIKRLVEKYRKINKPVPNLIEYYLQEDFGFHRYTGYLDKRDFTGDDIKKLMEFGYFMCFESRD